MTTFNKDDHKKDKVLVAAHTRGGKWNIIGQFDNVYDINYKDNVLKQLLKERYDQTKSTDWHDYTDIIQLTRFASFVQPVTEVEDFNKNKLPAYELLNCNIYANATASLENGNNSLKYLQFYIESLLSDIISFDTKLPAHKADEHKFLKAASELFPNVKSPAKAATSLRRFIENIYFNLKEEGAEQQQSMLWLYSLYGGTGKGVFMKRLSHFCNKYQIKAAAAYPFGRWLDGTYGTNLIGLVNEAFPLKSTYTDEIINLNSIIDNADYKVEMKRVQPVMMNSVITLVAGSNKLPFDENDRRYAVVDYNDFVFAGSKGSVIKLTDRQHQLVHDEYTEDDWDQVWLDAFTSCPFGAVFEETESSTTTTALSDLIDLVRLYIRENDSILPSTINSLVMTYMLNCGHYDTKETKFRKQDLQYKIGRCILENSLTPYKRINGNWKVSEYDWATIAKMQTLDEAPNPYIDCADPLEVTAKKWQELIGNDDNNPTDPTDEQSTDQTDDIDLEALHQTFCKDTFDIGHFDLRDDDQFIVTAHYTNEYAKDVIDNKVDKLDRKQEHLIPTQYVFESDTLSLDEQREMFEPVKDKALSITYSGSKSIHCLVPIPEDEQLLVKKDFKKAWSIAAKKLFGDKAQYLDKADASIGRLSRLPNGVRDNGKRQTCEWWNPKATGISIKEEMQQYLNDKAKEDFIRSMQKRTVFTVNDKPLIDQLKSIIDKTHNESGQLAYEILTSGSAAKGSNMIGAIGYIAALTKNDNKWYELGQQLVDICHSQHPSNITKKDFSKYVK